MKVVWVQLRENLRRGSTRWQEFQAEVRVLDSNQKQNTVL